MDVQVTGEYGMSAWADDLTARAHADSAAERTMHRLYELARRIQVVKAKAADAAIAKAKGEAC